MSPRADSGCIHGRIRRLSGVSLYDYTSEGSVVDEAWLEIFEGEVSCITLFVEALVLILSCITRDGRSYQKPPWYLQGMS